MTDKEKLQELEALAIHAREEGTPLSALHVLAVCEGRAYSSEKPRPLSHDLEIPSPH